MPVSKAEFDAAKGSTRTLHKLIEDATEEYLAAGGIITRCEPHGHTTYWDKDGRVKPKGE